MPSLKKLAKAAGIGGDDDIVSLKVNGKTFEGWQNVSIKRSLKAISGGFSLSVVDKWAEEQTAWSVVPGDECELSIGSDIQITGFVDSANPSVGASTRGISITGRDKAADMVDCSAVHKPGSWYRITLLDLAKKLAAPFDIDVTSEVRGLMPLYGWRIQPGESAFESLERAARLSGVLLINDGEGSIVITRAGTDDATDALVQGINFLSGSATYSLKNRYSKYIVKSQTSGADAAPEIDLANHAEVDDDEIDRYRPLVIIAEGAVTTAICKMRAKWERAVRRARSSQIKITAQGWRQSDGSIWQINQMTTVKAPWLGIKTDLLISDLEFKASSDAGKTTELLLEPKGSYDPDPTLISRKQPLAQLVLQEKARR